jgi:hypothetical protein
MPEVPNTHVLCRPATENDIPDLVALCARWQRSQVDTTQNGFLQLKYGHETFKTLVAENSIIIAEEDRKATGYYLVNPNDDDPAVEIHRNKVAELKSHGMLPEKSRIALGSQALLDHSLQGRGVRQMLLSNLVKHLTGRYEYLFATIPRENTRAFKAHLGDGWKIIDEDEKMFYVYWLMPIGIW